MRLRFLAAGACAAVLLCSQLLAVTPACAAEVDDAPPGMPLPPSPVVGALDLVDPDSPVDSHDWYWVDLNPGDRLKVHVDPGEVVNWATLYSDEATPLVQVAGASAPVWRFTHFVAAGSGGRFLLDVNGLRLHEAAGPYSVTWSIDRNRYTVSRVSGADRYETALEISRSFYPTGLVDSAVLATGERFPDALCATGLSGALGQAPLLLTRRDSLPDGTVQELGRLGVSRVFIIGGIEAISEEIETVLAQLGIQITRLAGSDRYDTSVKVAAEVDSIMGEFAYRAFVVNGDRFPDAASCGFAAARHGFPVLLVRRDSLGRSTAAAIRGPGLDPRSRVTIVGGTAVVATSVQAEIDALLIDGPEFERFCERIAGLDRYETSALVVREFAPPNTTALGLVSGESFPDAIAASSAIAYSGGPVLLAAPDGFFVDSTRTAFRTVVDPGVDTFLLGGASALGDDLAVQAEQELDSLYGDYWAEPLDARDRVPTQP